MVGILRPRKHWNGVEVVLVVGGRDASAARHGPSVRRTVHRRVMPERGHVLREYNTLGRGGNSHRGQRTWLAKREAGS